MWGHSLELPSQKPHRPREGPMARQTWLSLQRALPEAAIRVLSSMAQVLTSPSEGVWRDWWALWVLPPGPPLS